MMERFKEIEELEKMSKDLLDDIRDLNKDLDQFQKGLNFKLSFSEDLKKFQESPESKKLNSLIFFREIPFCHRFKQNLSKEVFKCLLLFGRVDRMLERFQAYREKSVKKSLKRKEENLIRIKRKRTKDYLLAVIDNLRNYETGMAIYSFKSDKIAFSELFKGLNDEQHLRLWLLIHNMQHYGDLEIKKIDNEEYVILNMTKDEIRKNFLKCKKQKEYFKDIANQMEKIYEDGN